MYVYIHLLERKILSNLKPSRVFHFIYSGHSKDIDQSWEGAVCLSWLIANSLIVSFDKHLILDFLPFCLSQSVLQIEIKDKILMCFFFFKLFQVISALGQESANCSAGPQPFLQRTENSQLFIICALQQIYPRDYTQKLCLSLSVSKWS